MEEPVKNHNIVLHITSFSLDESEKDFLSLVKIRGVSLELYC